MSDTILIIALCGRQGSGKTTSAMHLVDSMGYIRLRFADRLKKMLRDGLGIDDCYIDGNMKNDPCPELCGRTGRHAMITLGTEWGRNKIHKELWVMALYRDLKKAVNEGHSRFVIDDLRFLSEEKWLRSLGVKSDIPIVVKIIKLERDGVIILDHQSEKEIDSINPDWQVFNNNSVESLHKSLDHIVGLTTTN